MIYHVFRYDDLSATSSTDVEEALVDILRRHRVPWTFAAIPFACDPRDLGSGAITLKPFPPSKALLVKELIGAGLAEIGLHGYAHLAVSPMREHQEFSDAVPVDVQRKLLLKGRAHLEDIFGTPVQLYIPPWNRLATSTLEVLRELDFCVSGDVTTFDHVTEEQALPQLPCAVPPEKTYCALAAAKRFGVGNDVVGTMLHDYDFAESGLSHGTMSLARFEEELGCWSGMGDIKYSHITDRIRLRGTDAADQLVANICLQKRLARSKFARLFLKGANLVFWSSSSAKRLLKRSRCLP